MATKTAAKAGGGEGGNEMRVLVQIDMSTGDAETMGSGAEKPCTEHEEKKPKRCYKALVLFVNGVSIFCINCMTLSTWTWGIGVTVISYMLSENSISMPIRATVLLGIVLIS